MELLRPYKSAKELAVKVKDIKISPPRAGRFVWTAVSVSLALALSCSALGNSRMKDSLWSLPQSYRLDYT